MKVLLTGSCGFIGTHLLRLLVRKLGEGDTIVTSSEMMAPKDIQLLLEKDDAPTLHARGRIYPGDIRNEAYTMIPHILKDTDVVFHLAANSSVNVPVGLAMWDAELSIGLYEASRQHGVKRFVFASSCAVFGEEEEGHAWTSVDPHHPKSAYAWSKSAVEDWIWGVGFRPEEEMQTRVLRLSNVFGPGATKGLPLILTKMARGEREEPLELRVPMSSTRDYIHVDIVAQEFARHLEDITAGEPEGNTYENKRLFYNVCSGKQTSVGEMITLVEASTGAPINHTYTDTCPPNEVLMTNVAPSPWMAEAPEWEHSLDVYFAQEVL